MNMKQLFVAIKAQEAQVNPSTWTRLKFLLYVRVLSIKSRCVYHERGNLISK